MDISLVERVECKNYLYRSEEEYTFLFQFKTSRQYFRSTIPISKSTWGAMLLVSSTTRSAAAVRQLQTEKLSRWKSSSLGTGEKMGHEQSPNLNRTGLPTLSHLQLDQLQGFPSQPFLQDLEK